MAKLTDKQKKQLSLLLKKVQENGLILDDAKLSSSDKQTIGFEVDGDFDVEEVTACLNDTADVLTNKGECLVSGKKKPIFTFTPPNDDYQFKLSFDMAERKMTFEVILLEPVTDDDDDSDFNFDDDGVSDDDDLPPIDDDDDGEGVEVDASDDDGEVDYEALIELRDALSEEFDQTVDRAEQLERQIKALTQIIGDDDDDDNSSSELDDDDAVNDDGEDD